MITLSEMTGLARALLDADAEVAKAELNLSLVKERARVIREETIPSAMQELGLKNLVLDTGQSLSISQEVYASIPEDGKERAYRWLDDHGFGGLIKINVLTAFGKGEKDEAIKLFKKLQEGKFSVSITQTVHPQTLKAFLKEQLAKPACDDDDAEDGKKRVDVPLDIFGARPTWTAKIKDKKK